MNTITIYLTFFWNPLSCAIYLTYYLTYGLVHIYIYRQQYNIYFVKKSRAKSKMMARDSDVNSLTR